jgi:hypothetical protein
LGDGRDESQPEAVRNQISDGAVVIGPVVQAGTFTGQIHHHGASGNRWTCSHCGCGDEFRRT